MAYTINRRLGELIDSTGQLNDGKIPNDYINGDHIADNTITSSMLHTTFSVPAASLSTISIGDLSDVDITTAAPTDTQVLKWDNANSKFIPDDAAASTVVSTTAPSNPDDGQMWWDSEANKLYIYYNDGSSSQWVEANRLAQLATAAAASSSSIPWTRFYFDRGGVTPTNSISNSENVGKNFGTWTETTAANTSTTYVTPTSSTYDPTLTGVAVNSNGEFTLAAGVYDISASIYFKIYNESGNLAKYEFYLYGESGSDWAGSYDVMMPVPDTSLLTNNDFVVNTGGTFIFENATQSNNKVYLQIDTSSSPVNANLYPDYGFLSIRKIG